MVSQKENLFRDPQFILLVEKTELKDEPVPLLSGFDV